MAKVKTVMKSKETTVDLCYDQYLWIGRHDLGNHDPLIVSTVKQIKKLRAACDRLLRERAKGKKK